MRDNEAINVIGKGPARFVVKAKSDYTPAIAWIVKIDIFVEEHQF